MQIVYTDHAKHQMKRRNISEHEVEETIRSPEVTGPGNAPTKKVLRKHVCDRFIKVVASYETNIVVITTAVAGEDG